MLNITETIFQDMRGKAEDEETKTSLNDVMTEVKMLRHKYSEEQKVWRELQDIHSIEVLISIIKVVYRCCDVGQVYHF